MINIKCLQRQKYDTARPYPNSCKACRDFDNPNENPYLYNINGITMEVNSSELLFCTGEDGLLHLFSMCVAVEPEEDCGIRFQFCNDWGTPCDREKWLQEYERKKEEERKALLEKFKDQAKSLVEMGFSDEEMLDIIKECRHKNHILIDKNFRVYLVDNNMQEVEMNPLSKTLFLFYLKHPEGVALKCLSDYKAELSHIYSRLTGRESVEDIEKSILDMVDPTSNSVHEKCSRIKAAFKDKVSSTTLTDYVPSGKQGELRFISLDRNLVTWEGSL